MNGKPRETYDLTGGGADVTHTHNWPGINQQQQQHFIIICIRKGTMLPFSSMSASDPVHKYIAVRMVKTPLRSCLALSWERCCNFSSFDYSNNPPRKPPPTPPPRLSQDKHWKSRLVWSQRKTCKNEELFFTFGITGTSSEGIFFQIVPIKEKSFNALCCEQVGGASRRSRDGSFSKAPPVVD